MEEKRKLSFYSKEKLIVSFDLDEANSGMATNGEFTLMFQRTKFMPVLIKHGNRYCKYDRMVVE